MRTPNEVFKEMCPTHGEIWTFTESGWHCIRKDGQGNRFEDSSRTVPPLCVHDLLSVTRLSWAYFHRLSGKAELLISKSQKADLEATHTIELLKHEASRSSQMTEERQKYLEAFLKSIVESFGDDVQIVHPTIDGIIAEASKSKDEHGPN